ncbi:MAG: hypothetical protein F6K63_26570 [Moorea sp. SIO1G6]|uniref:hypothetical protein n=1 Tax=unclassified Moorena TaxID=2683338 RepID=UPI0013B93FBE|nr:MULTISPECIES: hypothetical protein [unclassified Moorena]NEQ08326.1 hypothetical protein [Moorena sp. SIO4E2]NES87027.1 hypothetical protein [Moorena sp. SIO2B7]NET67761.1 hypothetical protein [Moorena sp. SIO1G6]
MKKRNSIKGFSFISSAVVALSLALVGLQSSSPEAKALTIEGDSTAAELLSALQKGGHVIYFRHGNAVRHVRPDAIDQLPDQFQECLDPGRPLSADGLVDMQNVGEHFEQLNIPVGRVLASPACRCIETLWYAFNEDVAEIEVIKSLNAIPDTPSYDPVGLWKNLHEMLQTVPRVGTNTVLSAHSTNIKALTGLKVAQGEAVVFRPDGKGWFELVARIEQDDWQSLAPEIR